MINQANDIDRVAVVTRLAELHPTMGRTALVKYAYLLQTVKQVPLGYDFQLYSYGPYDSDVLADKTYARHLGAIDERPTETPAGIKRELVTGQSAPEVKHEAAQFLGLHEQSIEWVVKNFKEHTAAGMELIGTMVYADREAAARKQRRTKTELVETVLRIKPHFAHERANQIYDKLNRLGVLVAVQEA